MKDSYPFTMFNTIEQTCNFSLHYTKEYVKRDLKFLILVFATTFIILFSIFYVGAMILTHRILLSDIDIAEFEDPIFSGIIFSKIFGFIFSDLIILILFLFLCLAIIYSFFWITNSKAYFIFQTQNSQDFNDYKESLQDNNTNRAKIFISSLALLLLTMGLFATILFVIREIFLYVHILDSTNAPLSLLSIFFILLISYVLVGFTLLPTQMYPGMLRIDSQSYLYSMKKTYKIFSDWKVRSKYMLLLGIIAIIGYFCFGSLALLVALFLTSVSSINYNVLPVFLVFFSLICSFYFIVLFELGSIIIGDLYGFIIASLSNFETIQ